VVRDGIGATQLSGLFAATLVWPEPATNPEKGSHQWHHVLLPDTFHAPKVCLAGSSVS